MSADCCDRLAMSILHCNGNRVRCLLFIRFTDKPAGQTPAEVPKVMHDSE
jgi:hypothetical protein